VDAPVDIVSLKNLLTASVYERFKSAVELGKWPDGTPLRTAQLESCLQGIILYEAEHLPEIERTAYIPPKPADACEVNTAGSPLEEQLVILRE
jgi:hypothetical protein